MISPISPLLFGQHIGVIGVAKGLGGAGEEEQASEEEEAGGWTGWEALPNQASAAEASNGPEGGEEARLEEAGARSDESKEGEGAEREAEEEAEEDEVQEAVPEVAPEGVVLCPSPAGTHGTCCTAFCPAYASTAFCPPLPLLLPVFGTSRGPVSSSIRVPVPLLVVLAVSSGSCTIACPSSSTFAPPAFCTFRDPVPSPTRVH